MRRAGEVDCKRSQVEVFSGSVQWVSGAVASGPTDPLPYSEAQSMLLPRILAGIDHDETQNIISTARGKHPSSTIHAASHHYPFCRFSTITPSGGRSSGAEKEQFCHGIASASIRSRLSAPLPPNSRASLLSSSLYTPSIGSPTR